jgi:hypothetical protein
MHDFDRDGFFERDLSSPVDGTHRAGSDDRFQGELFADGSTYQKISRFARIVGLEVRRRTAHP